MIEGVRLIELRARVDDRGYLIKVLRADDPHFTKFGEVYIVGDFARGTVRAWHKHRVLWDYFHISHGAAKFALRDDRPDSPTYGQLDEYVLSARNPCTLVVPPGVYHGWVALEDDTQLVSVASELYDPDNPDEERIPWNSFDYDWSVRFR
ncbi:MAG: dTDP-4-dehydrorhamnose 3,5-epimerase family protein [Candidatus Binatia bacterium]|nr:dTDP-4-dehydrorhamnose 3,5-epimerase family protein [Candidatus Binatia bacterium]